jgi:hypothetical protein
MTEQQTTSIADLLTFAEQASRLTPLPAVSFQGMPAMISQPFPYGPSSSSPNVYLFGATSTSQPSFPLKNNPQGQSEPANSANIGSKRSAQVALDPGSKPQTVAFVPALSRPVGFAPTTPVLTPSAQVTVPPVKKLKFDSKKLPKDLRGFNAVITKSRASFFDRELEYIKQCIVAIAENFGRYKFDYTHTSIQNEETRAAFLKFVDIDPILSKCKPTVIAKMGSCPFAAFEPGYTSIEERGIVQQHDTLKDVGVDFVPPPHTVATEPLSDEKTKRMNVMIPYVDNDTHSIVGGYLITKTFHIRFTFE